MKRIVLSADSACDLDSELKKRCQVNIHPFHVIVGENQYQDGVNITSDDIYETYYKSRVLPKTAAINVDEYMNYFRQWTDEGCSIIHFSLGSALSSSHQNCCIAARELGNVYPIDSCSLSTGIALLIIEAAERIARGMSAAEIVDEINAMRTSVHASFIIDTLEFLHAGGRCSALAALGANLLKIKPCIEVDNTSGRMHVGKKYRGTLDKVLRQYTTEKLAEYPDLKTDRIFITHSGISEERIDLVRNTIKETVDFKEILVTRAGSTISSHCGPNTLGILFMTR